MWGIHDYKLCIAMRPNALLDRSQFLLMAIMDYVHVLRFGRNLRSGELLMSTTIVLWSVTQSTTVNF